MSFRGGYKGARYPWVIDREVIDLPGHADLGIPPVFCIRGICSKHGCYVGRVTGVCFRCHREQLRAGRADSRGVEAGSFRRPERSSSSHREHTVEPDLVLRLFECPMGEPLPPNAATREVEL